jgi:hypothetical protein
MTYDSETRLLFAREHADLLRASATRQTGAGRTRRWLSRRMIDLGIRLATEPGSPPQAFSRAVV